MKTVVKIIKYTMLFLLGFIAFTYLFVLAINFNADQMDYKYKAMSQEVYRK